MVKVLATTRTGEVRELRGETNATLMEVIRDTGMGEGNMDAADKPYTSGTLVEFRP